MLASLCSMRVDHPAPWLKRTTAWLKQAAAWSGPYQRPISPRPTSALPHTTTAPSTHQHQPSEAPEIEGDNFGLRLGDGHEDDRDQRDVRRVCHIGCRRTRGGAKWELEVAYSPSYVIDVTDVTDVTGVLSVSLGRRA